jgi:hypothetical protein
MTPHSNVVCLQKEKNVDKIFIDLKLVIHIHLQYYVVCLYNSQMLPQFIVFEISFNKNLTAIEIHKYINIYITYQK